MYNEDIFLRISQVLEAISDITNTHFWVIIVSSCVEKIKSRKVGAYQGWNSSKV